MKLRNLFVALRRTERGAAAVELAVVLPFLILMVAGVVDYGRAYYTANAVANAARAGAEFGARNPVYSGNYALMSAYAQADGQDAGSITFNPAPRRYCKCPDPAEANNCAGFCTGGVAPYVFVEVTATKTLATLLPYPGLASSISIARTATFQSQ